MDGSQGQKEVLVTGADGTPRGSRGCLRLSWPLPTASFAEKQVVSLAKNQTSGVFGQ